MTADVTASFRFPCPVAECCLRFAPPSASPEGLPRSYSDWLSLAPTYSGSSALVVSGLCELDWINIARLSEVGPPRLVGSFRFGSFDNRGHT